MPDEEWDKIKAAHRIVLTRIANRVDGDGWKVYRAGSIIRVDIDVEIGNG